MLHLIRENTAHLLLKMEKQFLAFFALSLLMISCKEEVTVPNGGIYTGVFTQYSETGGILNSGVLYIALFDENYQFQVSGDTVDNIPPTYGGEWVVDGANIMTFDAWGDPANPDNLMLDTTYNYTFNDVDFTLKQTIGNKSYEYILKRY